MGMRRSLMVIMAGGGIVVMVGAMIMGVMAVVRMTVLGDGAVAMLNAAVREVGMVVLVVVEGKRAACATKQFRVVRTLADGLRRAAAAHMAIQAENGIGARHHHVQIV